MRAPHFTVPLATVLTLAATHLVAQVPREPLPLVAGAKVVTLWPAGSPMLKASDAKEVFTMTEGQPTRVQKVVEVHNPSIELHLAPKAKANGVGIILAPGGGNKELVVGTEGIDIASWLNELYNAMFAAQVPVELRIYGHGGHGNGIKPRDGIPFGTWQLRFIEWMNDVQKPKAAAQK